MHSETKRALDNSNREHRTILDALKKRDGALAEEKMREHIRSVSKDAIFEYVASMQYISEAKWKKD